MTQLELIIHLRIAFSRMAYNPRQVAAGITKPGSEALHSLQRSRDLHEHYVRPQPKRLLDDLTAST